MLAQAKGNKVNRQPKKKYKIHLPVPTIVTDSAEFPMFSFFILN